MKHLMRLGAFLWCVLAAATAGADPFTVTTSIVTSGWFTCRSTIPCTGEGTSSLTFGGGTLTFTGVDSTFDVTNRASGPIVLGTFTVGDGFEFPSHPVPSQPGVVFSLNVKQSAPTADHTTHVWQLRGGTVQMGNDHFSLQLGNSHPFGYTAIVYDLNPFPFRSQGKLTADVGLVPEPACMLLVGTGLAGVLARRRRRRGVQPAGFDSTAPTT
jgi:hypothetical protein